MAGGNRGDDWNVGRELVQLQREMNRLAQRALRPTVRRGARVFPSLIISASDDRLVVRAEVPGMELENFEKLEEKIRQTVELINKLKTENQEITASYRQLEDEISDFQKGTKSSDSEAEELKKEFARRERDFEKKKKELQTLIITNRQSIVKLTI